MSKYISESGFFKTGSADPDPDMDLGKMGPDPQHWLKLYCFTLHFVLLCVNKVQALRKVIVFIQSF